MAAGGSSSGGLLSLQLLQRDLQDASFRAGTWFAIRVADPFKDSQSSDGCKRAEKRLWLSQSIDSEKGSRTSRSRIQRLRPSVNRTMIRRLLRKHWRLES
jgi:hypothetical protein